MEPETFLGLNQTAWSALGAIVSVAVVVLALVPLLKDKANLKVFFRGLDELGSVRNHMEISITNIGRRISYIDSIEFKYIDTSPILKSISAEYSDLPEGRNVKIITDSYPVTAISKINEINVIDSTGRRWKSPRLLLKKFVRDMERINNEIPKSVAEESAEREKLGEIYYQYKDDFFD